jgi:hypothetical protein
MASCFVIASALRSNAATTDSRTVILAVSANRRSPEDSGGGRVILLSIVTLAGTMVSLGRWAGNSLAAEGAIR